MNWWSSFQELFFLNFDWEMMTYWAVVGLSHALDFYRESQEQRLAAAQLGTRLAEAQLQSLQSQLHPHFLFNTLHTISALMHRDTEAADAMLARLSDLLRLSLDRIGTQQVTLKEEMDFLDRSTSRSSGPGSATVSRSGSTWKPETLDASVPNLLLQPLVENCHPPWHRAEGRRRARRDPRRREEGELCLLVRDTGPGLSAATLSALNTGVGLDQHAVAAARSCFQAATGSSSTSRRRAAWP